MNKLHTQSEAVNGRGEEKYGTPGRLAREDAQALPKEILALGRRVV